MHDLVLAIGGCTVEELRERMTHNELLTWIEYSRWRGPINPMLRIDAAIARLCQVWAGGEIRKYMPWPREEPEPEPEGGASIEAAFQLLQSVKKGKDIRR